MLLGDELQAHPFRLMAILLLGLLVFVGTYAARTVDNGAAPTKVYITVKPSERASKTRQPTYRPPVPETTRQPRTGRPSVRPKPTEAPDVSEEPTSEPTPRPTSPRPTPRPTPTGTTSPTPSSTATGTGSPEPSDSGTPGTEGARAG